MDTGWKAHLDAQIAASDRQHAQWARQRRRYLLTHPRELWSATKIDVIIAGYVAAWFAGALVVMLAVQELMRWV